MKKRLKCILLSIIMLLSVGLNGCILDLILGYELGFTQNEIYASVGDSVDLSKYLNHSSEIIAEVTFSCDDAEVGYLSGNRFIVIGKGRATVIASYRDQVASIRIIGAYDEIESMELISLSGGATGVGKEMEFFAKLNNGAKSSVNIKWFVNGNFAAQSGVNFYYTPKSAGIYKVRAEILGVAVTAEYEFVAYQGETHSNITYNGKLLQNEFSLVEFNSGALSSAAFVEWLINGEVVKSGITQTAESSLFSFRPSEAGEYDISCRINGQTADEVYTVTALGAMPIKNLSVDFDSDYPNIFVTWDAPKASGEYIVQIGDTEYSSSQNADRFEGNRFDASEILDITQGQQIKVSYAGDGVYKQNSASYTHSAVKSSAINYLAKKYFGGNYYLTDEEEFFDLFSYAMTFRPDAYSATVNSTPCDQIEFRAYMAYTSEYTPVSLADMAWQRASQTGSYYLDASGSTAKNGIFKIKISFATENIPDNFSLVGKTEYASVQIPHLGNSAYTEEFPIDGYPLTYDEIDTTEELYYVVNQGYKPNIKAGSRAAEIYDEAKTVLRKIIEDGMDEVEIAHAIFDYIMWEVSYDYDVLRTHTEVSDSVLQPAFYLDGVFDTGFAVCDGIAKSYSLMCNMMGIECMRVVGTATSTGAVAEHAWNKIKIGGEWYIVDCTWSDFLMNGSTADKEAASHKYFLISDDEAKYNYFENNPELYPRTAKFSYDFYGDGVDRLFRIRSNGNLASQVQNIVKYAKSNKKFDYFVGGEKYTSSYFTIEIKLDWIIAGQTSAAFYTMLDNKLQSEGLFPYAYTIVELDEICFIILK